MFILVSTNSLLLLLLKYEKVIVTTFYFGLRYATYNNRTGLETYFSARSLIN
jgi:hypothetical protein